tara:strand:+ start:900 stop:1181 length:282 start_codon:yes stop_codon:yes gene_type:complete
MFKIEFKRLVSSYRPRQNKTAGYHVMVDGEKKTFIKKTPRGWRVRAWGPFLFQGLDTWLPMSKGCPEVETKKMNRAKKICRDHAKFLDERKED